jgi:hypothetical protein
MWRTWISIAPETIDQAVRDGLMCDPGNWDQAKHDFQMVIDDYNDGF